MHARTRCDELVARFEAGTLPQGEWTHRAHLTVALWYASHCNPAEALDRMRTGILRLNSAHGVPTTPRAAITRRSPASTCRVRYFVRDEAPEGDWAERANRVVERYGARDLPLRYYSEARLNSVVARAGWVEPDLRPLP